VGINRPRSFFGFGGAAQPLADMDPERSLRVYGRDLFDLPIKSGSATAAAGFGGTATYWAYVAPLEVSARLANLEEIFLRYAIRHLKFFYAPASASTSTAQIALGYSTDVSEIIASISTPSQTQVLEMEAAALFSAWQVNVLEFKHTGTQTYHTSIASGTDADIEYQGALACTVLNGVASTTYGQLWVEYCIDFYKPCPILSNPTFLAEAGVAKIPRDRLLTSRHSYPKGVSPPRPESKDEKTVEEDEPVVLSSAPAPPVTMGWFGASPAPTPMAVPSKKSSLK
jgi:hypothetical protein